MGITILRRRRGSEQDGPRGRGVSPPGLFVFVVLTAAGVGSAALMNQPGLAIAGALIGIYFLFAIQVAEQWEKAAVLRLGRYRGLRGPGPFVIIPVIDSVSRFVATRVRVSDVKDDLGITRGTVPVTIDDDICCVW